MGIEVFKQSEGAVIQVQPELDKPEEKPLNAEAAQKPQEQTQETKATEETEVIEEPASEDDVEEEAIEADSETEEPEEKPKKKGGFQKRIEKLNRRISDAEREREYWRQEALRTQQQKPDQKPEPAKAQDTSKKPKAEDFATHDEYLEALVEWKADQKFQAKEQKANEERIKSEAQKKLNEHYERVNKFKESHDDFDDVWDSLKVPLPFSLQELIKESDMGPDLMYALAKDPKECKRICELSQASAAKEIGKLEVKLSKASTESPLVEPKPKASAPTPVRPVKAKGATNVKSIYDDDIDMAEWNRLRDAEQERRAARR